MLFSDYPQEVLSNPEARKWLEAHREELDLFDVLSSSTDGLVSFSFEALRDRELTKKYEEDDDWN